MRFYSPVFVRALRSVVAALLCAAVFLASPITSSADSVTLREAAWSFPHIWGDTDLEMARQSGREVARDRLGQLLLISRAGRGSLNQAFGALDPSFGAVDLEARLTGYTSSELNGMYDSMPAFERSLVLEYCKGVNDTIEEIYTNVLPEPIEVNLLRAFLGLNADLFGNATNISDQVDPFYLAPGGADPEHPAAGFQFTPEMAMSIGVLQVRNFGLGDFNEAARLGELQGLIGVHGLTTGTEIWRDLNFLNDPLAPATVPDPTLPGYGGPLASAAGEGSATVASASHVKVDPSAAYAARFPKYDYLSSSKKREAATTLREEVSSRWGGVAQAGQLRLGDRRRPLCHGQPLVGRIPADRHSDAFHHALQREPFRRGVPRTRYGIPRRTPGLDRTDRHRGLHLDHRATARFGHLLRRYHSGGQRHRPL